MIETAPPLPLPAIVPEDKGGQPRGYPVDVSTEGSTITLVLGEDLVLSVAEERTDHSPSGTSWTSRFHVRVCDGSANHLHTLAVTNHYPSDAVLAAAIETARLAFPNWVRIAPEEDR